MHDWDSGLIDFSSIPFKKNCALLTKLDWCTQELHLHSTFGPPQSYFSEFATSPFSVPLRLFTNRYFPLFASFFCVCTSILLSYSILCEQITADWPLVIKCMWRSTFKYRYCSGSPSLSDRLKPESCFYVQHKYFMRFFFGYGWSLFATFVYTYVHAFLLTIQHMRTYIPFKLSTVFLFKPTGVWEVHKLTLIILMWRIGWAHNNASK